ncbi:DUF3857 domain-containing protein [candidate division WOR-3 bacterium]|nr:DUF3857 domain-containing protein [candidate division WOR-3 bacterium]
MWLFLSLFITLSLQEVNIEKLIKNSPGKEKYPDAGALVLLDRKILEVYPDKSTSSSRYLVVKIFNDRGKSEYGDIKQRYNSEAQTLQILTARTHISTGEIVEVRKDAITDLSASEVARASTYTNARVKIVSFPALEPNAIIEYKCKVSPKKRGKSLFSRIFGKEEEKHFFGEVVFGAKEPILKKEFKLIVPDEIKFKYKLVNGSPRPSPRSGNITPEVKEVNGKTIYTWKLENIEPTISEPSMPPLSAIAPRLVFTSFDSWDELSEWLRDKFYKSVSVNKKMKMEIEKLVSENTKDEIIRDCFLYIVTQFRNIKLDVGLVGYTPNKATKVYDNKYGDPRDKVVLLCSLLKETGIESYPVFVNTKGVPIVKDIPSPSMFNHIILAIKEDRGYFLMDPQATNSKFGYLPEKGQEVDGFIVFKEGYTFEKTLSLTGEHNLSKSTLRLSLSQEGNLAGEVIFELTGFYDRKARRTLKNKTEKEKKLYFERATSGIATNARLISYSTSDFKDLIASVWIKTSFEAKEFASIEDETMHFFIPCSPFDFASLSYYVGLSKREYPLLLWTPRIIRYEVEIAIPDGFIPDYLPENLIRENDFAKVSISSDFPDCQVSGRKNGKIIYTSELVFKKRKINPEDYPNFKSIVNEFIKSKRWLVILKKRVIK